MRTEHMDDNGAFELTEDLDRARAIAAGERSKYLHDGFSETMAELKAHEASSYAMGQFTMERQKDFVAKVQSVSLDTREPLSWRISKVIMYGLLGVLTIASAVAQDWISLAVYLLIGVAILLMNKPHWFRRNPQPQGETDA